MAQVSKALKFRALCAQLTPTETKSFINSVIDVNGTVLFSALFHLILSSCTYKDFDADDLNRMVSNIILSRKKTPKQNATVACPKTINDLPPALVGHTASFLPQSDYIKLSTCARSLFIGCNTPNQMQELNLLKRKWKQHPPIDLAQFPSIKHLAIRLHHVSKLLPKTRDSTADEFICKDLNAITIDGNRRLDCSARELEIFLQQNAINLSEVTSLTLQKFGQSGSQGVDFNFNTFLLVTSAFDNVKYLNLDYVNCRLDPKQIKRRFSSLRGLSIIGGLLSNRIALIQEFAKQLKYLCMRQYQYHSDYNCSTVQFDQLEQLKIVSPSFQTVHEILNTAVELRYFGMHITYNKKTFMALKDIKQCMVELMTCSRSLEYVYVNCGSVKKEWFAAICEGIEFGLFKTKHWSRDRLRVKIMFGHGANEPVLKEDEVVFIIARMITVIQRSTINDYMFIVSIQLKGGNIYEALLPQLMENIPDDVVVKRMNLTEQTDCICVTNKQCKINGYSASWMSNDSIRACPNTHRMSQHMIL
eukprot:458185_1